jgi:pyruvate/2-oxoglutarate dehydrogenase complex dihydrolipoamide acyltransferase (E2) component
VTAAEVVVRMPKLADTLVEASVAQWLKRVGDAIRQGEALASIETDKVTTELTSPSDGTLLDLLVAEGQTVPIDTPIARIGSTAADARPGTTPPAGAPPVEVPPAEDSPRGQPPVEVRPAEEPPAARPRKTTPLAARVLAAHGLTPEAVPTTSTRLKKEDVLAFVASAAQPRLTPMRRAIAEHMTRSRQSIPHGQTVLDADLTSLVAWREAHKSAQGANITFTALFVYALAHQLSSFLAMSDVDLGVAVAVPNGLIVPVIRNANQRTLQETASAIADLAGRARANQLKPDETQGARMTLTNVGSFGNLFASPIIPLGQIGILGPGLVERRPLPTPHGGIRPGWRCLLSLMFDRRHLDDFAADRFLRGVAAQLEAIPNN